MRMERLIGIMCVLADAQRTTIGALAERFEVSTRTIARDLDTLGQAGVPLVTFPGAGGGVGVVEGFKVRRDLLSTHDAAALYAAPDEDVPGTFLVELDYDAADEFALVETIDARFLERGADEAAGVARFRTDDAAWVQRLCGFLGDLAHIRKP